MTAESSFPGPAELGRGAVVLPRQDVPELAGAPRFLLDAKALGRPSGLAGRLHPLWASRTPFVVELAVDPSVLAVSETYDGDVFGLDPSFGFHREQLFFLVWANNWDLRTGTPIWWWSRKLCRVDGGAQEAGPGDVVLSDGTAAFVDGGPRGPVGAGATIRVGRKQLSVVHRESVEIGVPLPAVHRDPHAVLAGDQLAAVSHGSGPARIVAPAGSGKTRVLTERLRHLVSDRGVEPSLVTALAYNTKAAEEMRNRLGGSGRNGPSVRTVHSLCHNILQTYGTRPAVIDEREVRRRIGALVDVRWSSNSDPLGPYLEALSAVRLGLQDPAAVERDREDVPGFAAAFERYRDGLSADNVVDFDEQVYSAIELIVRDPAVRRRVQLGCRHLLVDEFQDLTPAFLLLVRLVAAPGYDVFGVGDDDQVLYSHAGADPSFLIDYARYFPGAAELALGTNYRCPPAVVEAATNLLGYNRKRISKTITAARTDGRDGDVTVERPAAEEMAPRAVELVQEWLAAGVAPTQIALLCRVNAGLLAPQVLLAEAGIAVEAALSARVLSRTGIRTALAYLRLAEAGPEGPWLGADLAEVANRPSRRITSAAREQLQNRRVWTAAQLLAASFAGDKDAGRVAQLVASLRDLAVLAARTPEVPAILRHVRDVVGLGAAMRTLDGSKRDVGASHVDDLAALEAAASAHPALEGFEAWLRAALETASSGADGRGVRLASVHRVKGLEFERVVLLGVAAPVLPHELADDIEEERRILHVGITRAMRQAVVLAPAGSPAPFLDELAGTAKAPARQPRRLPPPERRGGEVRPSQRPAVPAVAPRSYAERKAAREALAAREAAAADPNLLEALRAWRAQTASVIGTSPSSLLPDDTLQAIAATRPKSVAELARCRGMGATRVSRWGDDILVVVEAAL